MKITFRLPSKAVQYGYAEIEFEGDDSTTGNQIGKLFEDYVREFWEGERGIKTKSPDSKAQEEFEKQLGAVKISEEKHVHKFVYGDDDNGHSGSFCDCGEEQPAEKSDKPWENKVKTTAKPWEGKGNPLADLFA